ncbi:hypothetical protein SAMN05421788_101989 [Filimonas lacunae]|uniref:Tetratricopeptide repeat-containing protein n=1 Tax=Filimonas lacunae TaxID=477680 RepID=A0A173MQ96_9BACT|nr:hypothetical protein [Filimonas lacunae]BAV09551.1 hypothetical protein FLA_5602 [Filimonas lacunae]SIS75079.1 hypothetical protein SAMN05421788_101989 [Filimonas lacunae]
MANTYTFEDIARYTSGDMSAEEQAAFEAALPQQPELQQKVALHREVEQTLQQQFAADPVKEQLQQTMQQLRAAHFTAPVSKAKVVFTRFRMGAITAAAAAVIAVMIWQPWQKDLYSSFAPTQMVANVERGDNTDSLLLQATTAFNKEDYATAVTLLHSVTQLQPQNSFAQFYYAVALTHINNMIAARPVFTQLYSGNSAFKYDAAFYMALSYIKEKNTKEAGIWLQKIPVDAVIYAKAQKLLQQL